MQWEKRDNSNQLTKIKIGEQVMLIQNRNSAIQKIQSKKNFSQQRGDDINVK